MDTWTIAADKLTSHAGWKMIAAAAFWLLAAGTAIASLQTRDLGGVRVVDVYDLHEGA